MTNAEATEYLELEIGYLLETNGGTCKEIEADKIALIALREQAKRGKGCDWCIGFCPNMTGDVYADYRFCPKCGRQLYEHRESEVSE